MLCHPFRKTPWGQIRLIKESNPAWFRGVFAELCKSAFSQPILPNLLPRPASDHVTLRGQGVPSHPRPLPCPRRLRSPLNRLSCPLAVMMAKEKPPITVVGDVGGRIAIIVVRRSKFPSSGCRAPSRRWLAGWLPPLTSACQVLTSLKNGTFLQS